MKANTLSAEKRRKLILSIVLLVTFLVAHYRSKIDALNAQYAK